uniref:Bestrophin homolog n=2 Tax=Wuchereria bancrofti TaxID=6293 RepID=A0A1I8EUB9_WUCBA
MTVSYHHQLASLSSLVNFRVLFRWKGSVWKLIYKELLVWTILFLAISFIYRSDYFLNAKQKIIFGNLAYYFDTRLEYIPITFILGFFVDTILSRWSNIITNMGYIESYALFISNCIHGNNENAKQLRQTLMRYLCLTQIFIFRDISIQVQKRFPTIDSLIDAGILLKNEKEKLDLIKFQYNNYWVPIRWIHAIALKARKQEIITSDLLYWKLCAETDKFRHSLQLLCNYDWVPIPLVYSQVVFLAVYVHFLICLISQQFIVGDNSHTSYLDLIVPVMTMIQFIFFIGWLKVAQALLNPFGDDDDDFECNYLIDKNLAQSFCIADNYDRVPDIQPDLFWQSQKVLSTSSNTFLNGSTVSKITCFFRLDHFEEPINRPSIQLEQYNKSKIDYFVLPNLNKNNKMEITRL